MNGNTPSPGERLSASRARLRDAWMGAQQRSRPAGAAAAGDSSAGIGWLASLLARWWRQHPLRAFAGLAGDMAEPIARDALAPAARQHPLLLVAASAAAGAVLVGARPWRWLPHAALSSALLSTLWPRRDLKRWLDAGGLARLLGSAAVAATRAATAPAQRPTTGPRPTAAHDTG